MRDPMQGYDAWKTAEPDLPDPPEHNEDNIEKLCQTKYDKMSVIEREELLKSYMERTYVVWHDKFLEDWELYDL
tara:strand:+ start:2848 stop:3069 length:222 start_codon:yes stop_codon:yes gene_type:complete